MNIIGRRVPHYASFVNLSKPIWKPLARSVGTKLSISLNNGREASISYATSLETVENLPSGRTVQKLAHTPSNKRNVNDLPLVRVLCPGTAVVDDVIVCKRATDKCPCRIWYRALS